MIKTHLSHVGSYRWLLLSFAVLDILISLNHLAFVPAIHMTEFGCIFWSYRWLRVTVRGACASLLWTPLYFQSFVLIAFHYVYRFVRVCKPPWLDFMKFNPWRNWIVLAIFVDVLFTGTIFLDCRQGFAPSDFKKKAYAKVMMDNYGIDMYASNRPGFVAVVLWDIKEDGTKEWLTNQLVTILILIGCLSLSIATILYCVVKIVGEMRRTSANSVSDLTSKTRNMQRQLFRALVWQTIIPFLTSYIPLGFVLLAPLITGVAFGGLGTLLLMSTQIFPMIDPFLVLLLIQGYRREVRRLMQRLVGCHLS